MSFMSFEVTKDTNLKHGTKNDGVKKLQTLLNQNGYNLAVDGSFGSQTLDAVKDFQKKNGLSVDGIVGRNTWGKLTGSGSSNKTTNTTTKKTTTQNTYKPSDNVTALDTTRKDLEASKPSSYTYADYENSDIVKQAEAMLQQQISNKPGEYKSNWDNYLNDTINKIMNREPFTYDVNGDALYQQYKDQYKVLGEMAMIDTMGQAAAMNGGYGSSYAQSVGQQAYQGYLQQLNDKVPELYQLARDQYNQEGQDLYNQYGLFADADERDYGRYRDTVSDYYTDLNYLTDDYRYKSETDYNRFMDKQDILYNQARDAITDWKDELNRADTNYWNTLGFDYSEFTDNRDFEYQLERDAIADALNDRQMAVSEGNLALDQSKFNYESGGALPGAGVNDGVVDNQTITSKANNGNVSDENIKAMQTALGFTGSEVDGKWGPKTQKKAQEMWGTTSADEALKKWQEDGGGVEDQKRWKDHDTTTLAKNQKAKGGSYYKDTLTELKSKKDAGATTKEVMDMLEDLVGSGYLSQSEYLNLAQKWRNNEV